MVTAGRELPRATLAVLTIMARSDRHDSRQFDHYAKLDADGHVVATVEVAAGSDPPTDAVYVFVTDCYPYNFDGVQVQVSEEAPAQKPDVHIIDGPKAIDAPGLDVTKGDVAVSVEDVFVQPSQKRLRAAADIRADLVALNKVRRA